jgi:hypothetical protein
MACIRIMIMGWVGVSSHHRTQLQTIVTSWRRHAARAKRHLAILVAFRTRAFQSLLLAWRDTVSTRRQRRALFLQVMRHTFAVRLCQHVWGKSVIVVGFRVGT